ncbi:MAG: YhgE/Pip family protein [Aeriscardovia sp.]|nr:YhgE/Pip family protein [Aeriscardovia sp.]
MLKIFKRDLKRLARTPASLLTLLTLLFLPAVYGWFSTYAYSDPYSKTGRLPVAVANMDSEAEVEGEKIDIGSQLVENLKKNNELGWKFVGEKEAEAGVRSGKYFAAFVVPKGFSQSLAKAIEDPAGSKAPRILYFSNQEESPVTPKITSIGAVKIQREINSQIDSALLKAVMEKMSRAAVQSKGEALDGAEGIMEESKELKEDLSRVRADQESLAESVSAASGSLLSASRSLSSLSLPPLSLSAPSFSPLPGKILEEKLSSLFNQVGHIYSLPFPSPLKAKASSALSFLSSSLSSLSSSISQLEKEASQARADAQSLLLALKARGEEAGSMAAGIPLFLSSSSKDLKNLSSALKEANLPLSEWENELSSLSSSISQLESSAFISFLSKLGALNASSASSFLSSPVQLETVPVYPASYVQAVSPFFLALCLWVGAFMLVVIYSLFPDGKGVGKIGPRSGYFARLSLFWFISFLQALVASIGEGWILGWKIRSLPLFFFSALFSSFVFTSIIYAMAVCMGKLGKALALVAVMIQIPASGGMYPVSLLPAAYRALYPLLPFTYSINLFRISLASGGAAAFAKNSVFLFLFSLSFTGAALLLFPALSSLQKSLNLRLKAGDFFMSEGENLPSSRRLEDAIYFRLALQPRAKVEMEWKKFKRRYTGAAIGICAFFFSLPLVPMILLFAGAASRSLFLFVWVGSYAAGMIAAAFMEYARLCAEKAVDRRL